MRRSILILFVTLVCLYEYEAKAVKNIKLKSAGKEFRNINLLPGLQTGKGKESAKPVRYGKEDDYIVFDCSVVTDSYDPLLECRIPKDAIISLANEIIASEPNPGPGPVPTSGPGPTSGPEPSKPVTEENGGELIDGVPNYCDDPEESNNSDYSYYYN